MPTLLTFWFVTLPFFFCGSESVSSANGQLYDTPLTNSSFVDLICSRNVAMIFWYGSSVLSPPSAEGRLSSVPSEAGLSASEAAGLALSSTVKALELLLAIELRSSPSAKLVLDDAAIEAMVE